MNHKIRSHAMAMSAKILSFNWHVKRASSLLVAPRSMPTPPIQKTTLLVSGHWHLSRGRRRSDNAMIQALIAHGLTPLGKATA